MYTDSKYAEVYIGRKAGRDIHDSIENAMHSVKIVSPFLTPQYIKELVHLKEKGVDITLITSDNLEESKIYQRYREHFSHKDVIRQERKTDENALGKRNKSMKLATYVSMISLFILLFGVFFGFLFLAIGVLGVCLSIIWLYVSFDTKIYNYVYHPLFKFKVFFSNKYEKDAYLIHSKIYVIDDKIAFLGSTNFTYTGFVKSYESAIKIRDWNAVKSISREVENLFNNTDLHYRNIQEWGKQIYPEPPHEESMISTAIQLLFQNKRSTVIQNQLNTNRY